MKFVPLRDFETITEALNFSTADCHVIGSCDLYTTKAAGSDKKLYKSIEHSLESQHESLVRLSASLSPPQLPLDGHGRSRQRKPSVVMPEIDLSRDSPFGPLSQISARRTFAYLIATLNATHPDYDFSNILRPSEFHRITGTAIKRMVDSTLMNMRPRRMSNLLSPPSRTPLTTSLPPGGVGPNVNEVWNERMWTMIDQEMDLRHCEKYSWEPEDDPFEAESALWTQHYFFFNKERKRVCYLNFRAFSVLSHSPINTMSMGQRSGTMPRSISNVSIGEGAGKRAQYWLGHSVDDEDTSNWGEDDDDEESRMATVDEDMEEDEEYTSTLDDVRDQLEEGYYSYDVAEPSGWNTRRRSMRGSSEGLADAMEI